ncbi:PEGA domain-containing protein [Anaerocolumna sedimenticola]|uniref:PEGA domain-containing protein n=1 Tax=Anaerocolumna sedimenticola TaxID=2696063 RepID=A0A6P1TJW5_9FIRM|nr:PEGA domain-containing protein [Anaerocolumna sedimenticola]QHQ60392.1 PEGA domain-containing protein [Anaerocolumna sedimenticola]
MDDKIISYKEHKKNKKDLFPFLLFGAFFLILVTVILSVTAQNSSKKVSSDKALTGGEESIDKEDAAKILAVLKEIDTGSGTITLLDTDNGQDIILTLTGGTNVVDKYEKVISVSQLTLGEMVDAYYDRSSSVVSKLQISNKAWEYKGVSNWGMDKVKNIFTIAETKYKYPAELVIFKQNRLLTPKDLDPKDELVVKGYDKEIWSIQVTRGHGTVTFEDYDDFIGGTVYIGNSEILPVVSDMSIVVKEGSYEVTMEKGTLKGFKKAEVIPFQDTVINMGEFKLPPKQMGKVKFNITPEGADLYINDELKDYSKTLELDYGEYAIKAALGGYITYSGKLEITGPSKTVLIDLVEAQNTGDNTESDDRNISEQPASTDDKNNSSTSEADSDNSTDENNTEDEKDPDKNYNEVKAAKNIYIQEPGGASAYFDGQFKGTVPISFPKVTGTHYITLIQSGHRTKTYTVEIEDDGEDVRYSFSGLDKSE